MKTSIEIDFALKQEVEKIAALSGKKQAVIVRMAIRAGLPLIANWRQNPKIEGYFADDYPLPKTRLKLESAMSKSGATR